MNKSWCYYVPEDQYDDNGYIPSIVTRGEAGHSPLKGNGEAASPWYWGKTLKEAKVTCAAENAKLGVSPDEALDILMSSMRVGR